jgi:hypothetical protein
MLREAYQQPLVEVAGAAALSLHLLSHYMLRGRRSADAKPRDPLHSSTG